MNCLECKNLEEAFEGRLRKYNEARSAPYYRVSTELAAKKNVDMERARNDLEEHQFVCVSAKAPRITAGTLRVAESLNKKFAFNDQST
jgi:hypothetical protein